MKVLEQVLKSLICSQVDTNNMQFGFMPGSSTTDRAYSRNLGQSSILARKGFMEKGHQKFHPPPFLNPLFKCFASN